MEDRLRLAEQIAHGTRTGISLTMQSVGLVFLGYAFLEAGMRDRAEELWQEHQAIAKRIDQPYYIVNSLQIDGQRALLDGRLEEATEIFVAY